MEDMFLLAINCRGVFKTQSNIYDGAFCNKNGFQPFAVFAKSSILDVWLGSEYACELVIAGQDKCFPYFALKRVK